MDLSKYQKEARKSALYRKLGEDFIYPTLGLAGEAGEVVENVKKFVRDDRRKLTKSRRESLKTEMGDLLWYLANLAAEFKIDLNDIAENNLKKLASRRKRGKIQGDGDNR